jgi:hypothetical protein
MTFSFFSMLRVAKISALSPLDPTGDCINIDFNLCSTDNIILTALRANYHHHGALTETAPQEDGDDDDSVIISDPSDASDGRSI